MRPKGAVASVTRAPTLVNAPTRREDLLQLFRPIDDHAQLAAIRVAPNMMNRPSGATW
ncbi:MAG TPA: hypothetical protein VIK60_12880 [Vicinamibacterales bacterium]